MATWSSSSSPKAAAEQDEWLARRLDQIRASLVHSTLSRAGVLELDDALDPLERIAVPDMLPKSAGALAGLRVALGEVSSPGGADETKRDRVEASVRAHLGLSLDERELRARLERGERATRAAAKEATTGGDERAIAARAEELTLVEDKCDGALSASRVRALLPPSERAPICGALRALSDASAPNHAASLVALHDDAVVALWALAIHAEGVAPERAIAFAHPFFGAQPDREGKLVRFAEARPAAAIGAGLAAELLMRDAAHVAEVSRQWLTFGDAPLDVVERALFVAAAAPR